MSIWSRFEDYCEASQNEEDYSKYRDDRGEDANNQHGADLARRTDETRSWWRK
jgi:hypothetical protein